MQPSLTKPSNTPRLSNHRIESLSRKPPSANLSKDHLRQTLQARRDRTLSLIAGITPKVLNKQSHPDFSPVGWHLGHIAYTEAMWILGTESPPYNPQDNPQYKTQYKTLFSADGLPKAEREHLPALPELLSYLAGVREQAIEAIAHHPAQLVHWLIQHEGQHAETIAMVIAMHHQDAAAVLQRLPSQPEAQTSMVKVEGGEFWQGSDSDDAIDNEMPAQLVSVEDFWIDRCLVTCEQFAQFMAKGGYENKQWWSKEGWEWKVRSQVNQPLYWSDSYWSADLNLGQKPVCGVSWYEAAAYAASVEKRLPTESEWEKAASSYPCCDLFGSVWEWTDTWFASYAGFRPFPYPGYSQAYFDGEHRVLKGSSWASCDSIARKSFRNWYHPHRRELFAGFRCARS